jgi:hypothetical protein
VRWIEQISTDLLAMKINFISYFTCLIFFKQ